MTRSKAPRSVALADVDGDTARIVREVQEHAEPVMLTYGGERVAVVLSPAAFELLQKRAERMTAELDDDERLSRAQEWQRAEAWATWERLRSGDIQEASKEEIDLEFDRALGIAR